MYQGEITKKFNELTGKEVEKLFREGILKQRAIEYAIRANQIEGLEISPETKKLFDQVAIGKISFEEYRQIIDQKARSLSSKDCT